MMNLINQKTMQSDSLAMDWEQIVATLDKDLPKIPQKPVVEMINPPPYAIPRVTFGILMPKDDDAKDKKGKKAAKKAGKKDDKPPKPIKWEEGPPKFVPSTHHFMKAARSDISENIFPLNIRGDQGNPGIAPCIIKEVYFPPDSPMEVATLIESALVY